MKHLKILVALYKLYSASTQHSTKHYRSQRRLNDVNQQRQKLHDNNAVTQVTTHRCTDVR